MAKLQIYFQRSIFKNPRKSIYRPIFWAQVLCYLLLSCGSQASEIDSWQPVADESAVVESGNKRFTVLTSQLIRMEYAADKQFNDNASTVVVNRKLPVPEFTVSDQQERLIIKTSAVTLTYQKTNNPFDHQNLRVEFLLDGNTVNWFPGKQDDKNLGGTARTLDGMNGGIDWNGKPLDLGEGIISRSGWKLLEDSHSHGLDLSQDWAWVTEARSSDKHQDLYLFAHGHNYQQALRDYTLIAGNIPMPPKYAFGYWWSRYWVYSDNELKKLMTQMRDFDIPIDVLVIDMDWHLTHGGLKNIKNPQRDPFGELLGWTGYTWNPALFPEPEKFLNWTEEFDLKTALNLHPASGIPPMEAQYQTFADQYGFDTSEQAYIHYRLAEKKWAETYVDTILRPLENQGVDFWWLDWQQFPESKVMPGLSNTWWLNYVFFTDMQRQGKRPLLFHRWGGMGNHRYQIGFSGDDKISWGSLQYQSYFTATASNVGYGYWSHDIGGHGSGELDRDAQLYLRWLQFGVFSPIFRTHSAKISTIERRFWQYPDKFESMRDLVKLRYALNPYVYTASRQAFDTGVSMVRPMYYHYPKAEQAYQFKHQYLFGDDMLVAPVDTPVSESNLLATKQIWLPPGEWFEWSSGDVLTGDKILERQYSETEIPVFVKAGAIIPMYGDITHLQQQIDEFELMIAPGAQGETKLYEDNGENLGYQTGRFATTNINHYQVTEHERMIVIAARQGEFDGQSDTRQFTLLLPASLPLAKVMVNGIPLDPSKVEYDGEQLGNRVTLPRSSVQQPLEITLVTDKQLSMSQADLYGKVGQFNRLSKAVADLKIEVARKSWWATLPDPILRAEQTPRLISSNPQQIGQYLQEFEQNVRQMKPMIMEHNDARKAVAQTYVDFLGLK